MTEPSSPDVGALLGQVGWLQHLARQLSGDPHLGEDLAQDAWVAALTHRPRQDRPLGPWLAMVVRNLLRDTRRHDEHRRERERSSARPESDSSASELVERAELHRRLVDAVLSLEEPYRSVILMRYLGELPPR